jgi:hypothetical protein
MAPEIGWRSMTTFRQIEVNRRVGIDIAADWLAANFWGAQRFLANACTATGARLWNACAPRSRAG